MNYFGWGFTHAIHHCLQLLRGSRLGSVYLSRAERVTLDYLDPIGHLLGLEALKHSVDIEAELHILILIELIYK